MAILSRILTQRGEEDAVLEGDSSDGQWGEDFGDWVAARLRVFGCSRRRNLCWSKVGDAGRRLVDDQRVLGDRTHVIGLLVSKARGM